MEALVQELEGRLGFSLPADYRAFLLVHHDRLLDHSRLFLSPRSGVIDELFTVADLLKNDGDEQVGIPEKSLMHIGGNLLGGSLYLKVSDDGFGELHYMENYVFREQFPTFSVFMEETQPETA